MSWSAEAIDRRLFATREPEGLRPDAAQDVERYRSWLHHRELERARQPSPALPLAVALLLVLDRPQPTWLRRCLRAVVTQTHPHVELAVVTTTPLSTAAEEALTEELAPLAPFQVARVDLGSAASPAAGARAAMAVTHAPLVAILGQHDELAADALTLLVGRLGKATCCYGDEDEIDDIGAPSAPRCKPDWSPELLVSCAYLGRPVLMRRQAVIAAGGIAEVGDGDWEHDLMLRLTESASSNDVLHLAETLYHRRRPSLLRYPTPSTGPGAVKAALARRGERASVEPGLMAGTWRV